MLTLYTAAGFTKVFISRASPRLRVFFLFLPLAVKGKSKLEVILQTFFNEIVVTPCTHPTVVQHRWTHTRSYRMSPCLFTVNVFSNIHRSTSHPVTLQCWSFFTAPTHNQPGGLFYSLSAQVAAKHNNTSVDICLS